MQKEPESQMKNVLVTGGAGFIGANLVRQLTQTGYSVTVFDNLSVGSRESLRGVAAELIEGNILDRTAVASAVRDRDGIVHLAAQTGVPASLADPHMDCEVNVIGTLNLLEACRGEAERRTCPNNGTPKQKRFPRFIFASSNAPLGRQTPPATEDKAPLPVSPYGASKLAGEAYCLAYHGSWGVPTVALRFGNVYGPFCSHKGSVVAKFMKEISAGRNLQIDGDGGQTRDFIYVGDLCRAIQLALESDVSGEVFQVATGIETSIRELAELIQQAAGTRMKMHHGPARQGDVRRNYSLVEKARDQLGWEPAVNLVRGLNDTFHWFFGHFAASGESGNRP